MLRMVRVRSEYTNAMEESWYVYGDDDVLSLLRGMLYYSHFIL